MTREQKEAYDAELLLQGRLLDLAGWVGGKDDYCWMNFGDCKPHALSFGEGDLIRVWHGGEKLYARVTEIPRDSSHDLLVGYEIIL